MGEAVQSVKEGTTNGAALDYEAVVVGAGIAGLARAVQDFTQTA